MNVKLIPLYEDEIRYIEERRIVFVPVIRTITVGGLTMDKLTVIDGHVMPEIDIIPVVVRVLQGYIIKRI